jgi:hypothetical protein
VPVADACLTYALTCEIQWAASATSNGEARDLGLEEQYAVRCIASERGVGGSQRVCASANLHAVQQEVELGVLRVRTK